MKPSSVCDDAFIPARLVEAVDVVVVGSGAGGLAAAVTAAQHGLTVMVLEKDAVLGGTTAWSGGWMWLPCNGLAGPTDDVAMAHADLRMELGEEVYGLRKPVIDAYLRVVQPMLRFFGHLPESLQVETDPKQPDFHGPPSQTRARAARARAFNGRRLGANLVWLRRPLPELTLFGMQVASGTELNHLFHVFRSPISFVYVLGRVLCYALDLLRHGRGMRLVNGQALVGRLLAAALKIELQARGLARGAAGKPAPGPGPHAFTRIGFFPSHAVRRLTLDETSGAVTGVVVENASCQRTVTARRAVVLACGGFPHDMERLSELVPHAPHGYEHHSAAPLGNTGEGLRLGEKAGGRVLVPAGAPMAWAPVSRLLRPDRSVAVYPHLVERGKPGLIAVDRMGRRFCDEAAGYHDFMEAWIRHAPANGPLEAWLVCDACFLWRYGLGAVKPWWRLGWRPARRAGYLLSGATADALARACGIDSAGLTATLTRYNNDFKKRPPADPQFHRGATEWDRYQGDDFTRPNPCLGPISQAPFFAVRLEPGSLGTLAGLDADVHGRVLGAAGQPIPGLYACGNDMASWLGGFYPGNGVTIGAAMVFGYMAGCHVAGADPMGATR